MPATHSFFQRLGSLFRANGHADTDARRHRGGNGHGAAALVAAPATAALAPVSKPRDNRERAEMPPARRRRSKDELREGYLRTVELMDAMQEHFRQQDRRAEQLIASVDRIGQTLRDAAGQQRAENDRISVIAKGVEHAAQHAERLSLVLDALPNALQSQAEAVQTVARQMQAAQIADAELTQSLERFGLGVESLRESGTVQVETLERLHLENRDDRKALREFVRIQNRRFLLVFAIAGTLGIGALVALVFVLVQALTS